MWIDHMSRTGNNAETKPAKLGLTIPACDVCVCHKNRQLNQYSKAEPDRVTPQPGLEDQQRLENRGKRRFFYPQPPRLSSGDFTAVCVRGTKTDNHPFSPCRQSSSNTFLPIHHQSLASIRNYSPTEFKVFLSQP